ncbi:MAG: AAA family ATPase [Vulcanimicrobiota bacterium]
MQIGPLRIHFGSQPVRATQPGANYTGDIVSLGQPAEAGFSKPSVTGTPFPKMETEGYTLSNLGGHNPARQEFQKLVDSLRDGGKPPFASYLIKGNTGAGKTTLVRALAGELDGIGVPTFHAEGADFSQDGPQKLRQLFMQAQQAALKSPKQTAVIAIDEIEAAARIRSGNARVAMKVSTAITAALSGLAGLVGFKAAQPEEDPAESHQTLVALTSLMDKNTNLILIGTSSRSDTMDFEASKRFQRELECATPSGPAERLSILQSLAAHQGLEVEPEVLQEMADASLGANPLGLQKSLRLAKVLGAGKVTADSAREARLQESFGVARPITNPDWMLRLTICHEMGHVVVRHLFEELAQGHPDQQPKGIDAISFAPRGTSNAAVYLKSTANPASTFEWYMAEVASNLAGRTSEAIFGQGHSSAGPGGDISYASKLVREAVREKGMGQSLGPVSPSSQLDESKAGRDQEQFTRVADQIATSTVEFYRDFTETLARELVSQRHDLSKLTLSGQAVQDRLRAWETATPERAAQLAALKSKIAEAMRSIKPTTSPGLS